MKIQQVFIGLFFLISLLHIWSGEFGNESIAFYTKPMLLILLASWFFISTKNYSSLFRNLIVGALLFSFLGDTLLMFVTSKGEHFFLLGLFSFLIAHLLYVTAFYKYDQTRDSLLKTKKWIMIPFVLFFVGFNMYLLPDISKSMQVPVMIYSIVILMMVLSALNLNGKTTKKTFQIIFVGALLFMFSDMILAVNKFKRPLAYSHISIMLLYLLGQFFIAKGSIELLKERS